MAVTRQLVDLWFLAGNKMKWFDKPVTELTKDEMVAMIGHLGAEIVKLQQANKRQAIETCAIRSKLACLVASKPVRRRLADPTS